MKGAKSKPSLPIADPFETGRELIRSMRNPATKVLADEAKAAGDELLTQLFGGKQNSHSSHSENGTHAENADTNQRHTNIEIFNFMKHKASSTEKHADKAPHRQKEAAIDYHKEIVKNREHASKGEMREMQRNIEQIKIELSKLITSSQILKLEFAEVAVEQTNKNIGEYHITFFEWLLTMIRTAREKVEDSNAWLGTVKGKGAKRDYWGMFKKHGTTFGLSGERAVATQVG